MKRGGEEGRGREEDKEGERGGKGQREEDKEGEREGNGGKEGRGA